ncbi:DUF4011 domain-containing protein [Ruminococcus flavefaciens]|uniref:Superfamily I DNA and/or RNA helicase n=1 Tax=Ruminococcus flavefaciens TaxID=1265 RepID=A0A1M7KMC2_RUMFL|nr:DUF4011 domain-containing protein [Ruminococcus flavefaciens]SHM66107.1 Superfamily I DNA and/or RNA helicase [Ruminococcus flavefaciens]
MENKITFSGNMTAQINFAMQQNYVPVFRNIVMTNNSDEEVKNVRLRIRFEPEFAKIFESAPIDLLPAQPVEIAPINIIMLSDYLFSLTEKLVGSVTIEALQGEEVIASENRSIELLAYDQWSGINFMPETAAAFVSPNHSKVQEIMSAAGAYLKKWCDDPAFTGYQTRNPNIVKMQMGAIYAALQEQNIAYAMPPASFEEAQRIRMPDTVLELKQGTCIDLSVLYCSCLEAAGLNPMLILVQDHAFAACWLDNETFSDCLQYDMSAITKRIAHGIDAICAVECTDLVAGKNIDFDDAEKHAAGHLDDAAKFIFAIDISRTRSSGIRPVPARVYENGTFKAVDYGERKKSEITSAPNEIDIIGQTVADGEAKEVTKQVIWERKLLDLSLRNSLLNFRPSAMSVQLMISDLGVLEDEISKGEDFKVMPMPNDTTLQISDSKIYEIENDRDLITTISESEFKSRRLRTFMKDTDLEKVMKKLHRQAKVSIEENGVNTIYLALGFLRWYETEKSDKARYAPLVLVPVDIIRKVQEKTYLIRMRDEDTQVNITMLEMLRQFFGIDIKGIDPVPEDENGVNLQIIFNTIRQGIMSQPRWDIVDYAFIGQFSFNRFIMWNDIRNRADELEKNKVVASLISGKTEWAGDDLYISPLDLDNKVAPSDLVVPLSADSSQLAAVYAASQGKSFVLHGPPGSGKSQTITNMIASALYQGKSVLFVAEKMAALSVVEKRLNKVGLGPFCIELHSNKAQKRAVLKQLEETLNVGRIKKPAEYKAQADKIAEMRKELNGTMEEIHKKRNFGCSMYDAAVRYEKNSKFGGKFTFTNEQLDAMSDTSYSVWHETLESLAAAGREFGDVTTTALGVCELTSCTPETRGAMETKLRELKTALTVAQGDTQQLVQFTGSSEMTFEQCKLAAEILTAASGGEQLLADIIGDSRWNGSKEAAQGLINTGKELSQAKDELLSKFEPSVLGYNASDALVRWKTAQGKWFIGKALGSKKLVKELAAHAKSASTVTKSNITQYYDKINQFNALKTQVTSAQPELLKYFGTVKLDENADWSSIEKCVSRSSELGERMAASAFAPDIKQKLCDSLKNGVNSDTSKISADYAALENISSQLRSDFGINTDKLITGENLGSDAQQKADAVIEALPQLKEWTGIVTICNKLRELGIGNVADAYMNGDVPTEQLLGAFDCDISKAMVTSTISRNSVLSRFQGTLFEETIRKFGEVLDDFSTLSIKELAAELSAKIPAPGSSANSSEIGILQKAIKSNGRMMSIRKLFDSIPNLLRRMCPVMLMSPISVAQYIDPSYPKFDLVIFDEASQLPTCEAVGAIARGENVIVVGDPKQLPPTSFFASNQVDEENYEKEDLESVLDDCLALSMPQKHLLWHYRSRHESLIAYSNSKYYENKLYTFPSPDDQISEVSWVHVEGYYDKSSTRTNKAEAQAVVEEICRRLRDPELRKFSIGVVTFSQPQQNLIDDLLIDAYRDDPKLEEYANEMYEPILIKNLENVQGDERDVIMFSIGYGPDKDGKVSMNFGPLNRDGGWRRLNVAISRSKCKMIVFSVITPDMIDLSRTRSDGVEGLKGFLEFAAKGRSALPVRAGSKSGSDGFETVVADEIRKMGYECKCSVGCSDYKVDVAVVNPDKPDTYIMGINCGNESYFHNGTASDRSLSQPSVLKGLGWNVMSVYIIDWLDNKEKVLGKIKAEIDNAIERYRNPAAAPKAEEKKKQELVFETEQVSSFAESFDKFETFKIKALGTSENFSEGSIAKITKCINDILAAEAPMNKKTLAKKTFSCWGISRPGSNMKALFDSAFEKSEAKVTTAGENEYVWLKEQEPENYDKCRTVYSGDEKRDIDEVAPEEIAVGIREIMSRQVAMAREDLLREVAHLFGFTRITPSLETSVSLGIKAAKNRGWVGFTDDGRVSYTGN